jgi:hypothetical protein
MMQKKNTSSLAKALRLIFSSMKVRSGKSTGLINVFVTLMGYFSRCPLSFHVLNVLETKSLCLSSFAFVLFAHEKTSNGVNI